MKKSKNKENRIWICVFLLLFLAQFALLLYFGGQKAGFHEDELYSYYSSNKTAGFFISDRTWITGEGVRNELTVLPGEQFRYSVVKLMQSWDVHPPLYYYFLHTACSLFPGVFSKWLGIGVNLIGFAGSYLLLALLSYRMAGGERRGYAIALLTCLAWGISPAVISGVLFIRMYQWLTFWILLCALLHVIALQKERLSLSFYVPLMLAVFCGFLTQYYYMIFHFFLGAGFCFLLLVKKRWRELLCYMISCGAAFAAAVLYYPASLSHIFRGYRGTEAVSEFTDAGNTLERLQFFISLFDEYALGDMLVIVLLVLCLLWVTVSFLKKQKGLQVRMEQGEMAGLLLFSCAGYFFTVSKTALLLGNTSTRYMLPIYGLVILLLLIFLAHPMQVLFGRQRPWNVELPKASERSSPQSAKKRAAFFAISAALILLVQGISLKSGHVIFLYPEEAQVQAFVQENKDLPVVIFYNEASSDNVWRLSDELIFYDRVYLASEGNTEALTEEVFLTSDRILAYVADYENGTQCLNKLVASNDQLSGYTKVAEKGLWTLYELQ